MAAFEIMGNNLRVQDTITNGESEGKTFYEIISASVQNGWMTFDMSIVALYAEGKITEETAMAYASHKPKVSRGIDKVKQSRGEKTTDIDGLAMDGGYEKSKGLKKKKR